jgi:hypothetical protein
MIINFIYLFFTSLFFTENYCFTFNLLRIYYIWKLNHVFLKVISFQQVSYQINIRLLMIQISFF